MIRILGNNLPAKKKIFIALTSIYGVGLSKSFYILNKLGIDSQKKCGNLLGPESIKLRTFFEQNGENFEGSLKRLVAQNIQRLIQINCYRGKRHLKGLPVRGQRTRANSKTSRKKKVKNV